VQASSTETTRAVADPAGLAGRLGDLLRTLFLDPHADHLGAIEKRELSLTQVRALYLLATEPDEQIAAGALAERLGLSPAAISRSLDSLVRRRLVSRRQCREDRRIRLVQITAAGQELVGELVALRNAGLERFVGRLEPEQRERLSAALESILAAEAEGR
jgi:DNA-binding MarR family transcriptional regulator